MKKFYMVHNFSKTTFFEFQLQNIHLITICMLCFRELFN